ncbi:hypothetical protein [uncultured Dysgonomonas sp.]|uniref:Uncharacterized protein n=1 Tax=uncultured Dysgonomonas sp. TaxID=206096 RepID=A0A212JDR5_9BACT|nr:hypothetical protein [uncultured Dysgonomonas sp.]SBV97539.1 conserved hypothetical protein [uncultured Dysgonomonas sp.]
MVGAETFVENNFGSINYTFKTSLELIIYGYSQLKNSGLKVSRSELLKEMMSIRNKKEGEKTSLDLEDYLRNVLVNDYIEPNRVFFGLENFKFHCGVEELYNNIRTGILDIKVCSSGLEDNVYYIFECKRLNKNIIYQYIHEGIVRFTTDQKYYPSSNTSLSGMISFLESEDKNKILNACDVYSILNAHLNKHKEAINLLENLNTINLISDHIEVSNFNNLYYSNHKRNDKPNILICHIVLDYNDIVIE